jgi:hypothetical protein
MTINAILPAEQHYTLPTSEDIRRDQPNCEDFAAMYKFLLYNELPDNDKQARAI